MVAAGTYLEKNVPILCKFKIMDFRAFVIEKSKFGIGDSNRNVKKNEAANMQDAQVYNLPTSFGIFVFCFTLKLYIPGALE